MAARSAAAWASWRLWQTPAAWARTAYASGSSGASRYRLACSGQGVLPPVEAHQTEAAETVPPLTARVGSESLLRGIEGRSIRLLAQQTAGDETGDTRITGGQGFRPALLKHRQRVVEPSDVDQGAGGDLGEVAHRLSA